MNLLYFKLSPQNKVIIFDVDWNPSLDEQAQDRAYRIGQERDVEVIRLISKGTIDELKYMRQLYKVHLKQQTLASDEYTNVEPARIFRGVDKDKHRKGGEFVTATNDHTWQVYSKAYIFPDRTFWN